MLPWVELDRTPLPAGDLRLMQRGRDFSIKIGVAELMTSRLSGSEEALATLACAKLADRPAPHILIGGLGMGFTLRAALGATGPQAKIVVAELVPTIVTSGAPGAAVSAYHRRTGELAWKTGDDTAGYSSPALLNVGGRKQVVAFTGKAAVGLAPETGAELFTPQPESLEQGI